jgi:hypothetical protein
MMRIYRARAERALYAGSRATSQQGQILHHRTVGKIAGIKAPQEFLTGHLKFSPREDQSRTLGS